MKYVIAGIAFLWLLTGCATTKTLTIKEQMKSLYDEVQKSLPADCDLEMVYIIDEGGVALYKCSGDPPAPALPKNEV